MVLGVWQRRAVTARRGGPWTARVRASGDTVYRCPVAPSIALGGSACTKPASPEIKHTVNFTMGCSSSSYVVQNQVTKNNRSLHERDLTTSTQPPPLPLTDLVLMFRHSPRAHPFKPHHPQTIDIGPKPSANT